MKKVTIVLMIFCSLLVACTTTPDEYLGRTLLNCNILFGFAGRGMEYEFANPSEKLLDQSTMETAPMTREELLNSKLESVESNFEKVKSLSINNETKEMIEATIGLYEFVLPVYKNEYKQLATLYDNKAGNEEIAAMEKSIREKYAQKFDSLYNAVQTAGFAYAQKNGIPVQTVNPVPGN